jgi:hypothetical protein
MVKIVHRPPVAPAAVLLDVLTAHEQAAVSIPDFGAGVRARLSLIGRRRRHARMRDAGRAVGWVAAALVLLTLILAAAVGLR